MALATRYEVSTQVASSMVAERLPGDVRQRHVDHGGVQHLHEGAEHDRDGDDPGVDVLDVVQFERRFAAVGIPLNTLMWNRVSGCGKRCRIRRGNAGTRRQ